MRIHICGIYGSGKSTLAKILSKKFNIPFYSLDDIKYKKKYSEIRSAGDRIKEVKKICRSKNWITEGTWSNYAEDAFKKADIIIIMKTSKLLCVYRILTRHLFREKYENDTFFEALKLSKEVYKYHLTKNPVSSHSHKNLIKKYRKKCLCLRKKSEIPQIIEYLNKDIGDFEKPLKSSIEPL